MLTCEKRSDKISLLRLTEKQQRTLTNKQQCNPEKFLKQKLDFSESSKERPRNSNARLVLERIHMDSWDEQRKRKKESSKNCVFRSENFSLKNFQIREFDPGSG